MNQRLSRSLRSSGDGVCWFCRHGQPITSTARTRRFEHTFSSAASKAGRIPLTNADSIPSTRNAPPIRARAFATRIRNNAKDQSEAEWRAELAESPHIQLDRQLRLECKAEQLSSKLIGNHLSDRMIRLARQPETYQEDGLGFTTDTDLVTILLAQIESSKSSRDLQLVLNVAMPLSDLESEAGWERFKTVGKFFNDDHTSVLLLRRMTRAADVRHDLVFLATLISRIERARIAEPVNPRLYRWLLRKAASAHFLEPFRIHSRMVKALLERNSLNHERPFLLELLQRLSRGLRNGSSFTNSRQPRALLHILDNLQPRVENSSLDHDDLIFRDWRILYPWTMLLVECNGTGPMWRIWNSLVPLLSDISGKSEEHSAVLRNQLPAFFIHMFLRAGDPRRAWEIAERHGPHGGIGFHQSIWKALLAHVDYKPATLSRDFDKNLGDQIKRCYLQELEKIEAALNVEWDSELGRHVQGRSESVGVRKANSSRRRKLPQSARPIHSSKWPAAALPYEQGDLVNHLASIDDDHLSWANLPRILSGHGRSSELTLLDQDNEPNHWALKRSGRALFRKSRKVKTAPKEDENERHQEVS